MTEKTLKDKTATIISMPTLASHNEEKKVNNKISNRQRVSKTCKEPSPPPTTQNPAEAPEITSWVRALSGQDGPVLITGETGTGKSALGRRIHDLSCRAGKILIVRGCGEFDAGTVEAQLFGHSCDAYTGAITEQDGVFKMADGGTLILDDIDYLPKSIQTRLLRFLDDGTYYRLGQADQPRRSNVRLIVTTNKDLMELHIKGQFLADLYYRLSHWKINLPPLRSRPDVVKRLSNEFLVRFDEKRGTPPRAFTQDVVNLLAFMPWRGNVRELKSTVENIALLCASAERVIDIGQAASSLLDERLLHDSGGIPLLPDMSVDERIFRVLAITNWNISLTSRIVGVSRTTVHDRISKRGWSKPV